MHETIKIKITVKTFSIQHVYNLFQKNKKTNIQYIDY